MFLKSGIDSEVYFGVDIGESESCMKCIFYIN